MEMPEVRTRFRKHRPEPFLRKSTGDGRGRMKVRAVFDGIPYDGSVFNMGLQNKDGTVCYQQTGRPCFR